MSILRDAYFFVAHTWQRRKTIPVARLLRTVTFSAKTVK
jgi:hypothetical protein